MNTSVKVVVALSGRWLVGVSIATAQVPPPTQATKSGEASGQHAGVVVSVAIAGNESSDAEALCRLKSRSYPVYLSALIESATDRVANVRCSALQTAARAPAAPNGRATEITDDGSSNALAHLVDSIAFALRPACVGRSSQDTSPVDDPRIAQRSVSRFVAPAIDSVCLWGIEAYRRLLRRVTLRIEVRPPSSGSDPPLRACQHQEELRTFTNKNCTLWAGDEPGGVRPPGVEGGDRGAGWRPAPAGWPGRGARPGPGVRACGSCCLGC